MNKKQQKNKKDEKALDLEKFKIAEIKKTDIMKDRNKKKPKTHTGNTNKG